MSFKIFIYPGGLKTVKKSGVGQAIMHQMRMLHAIGADVTMEDGSKADIMHINTVFPDSPLAAMRARRKGKKVIYYGHSTAEDFRNSFIGSNIFAGLFKKWISFCYSKGDIIITPTDYSKGLLETYGLNRKIYAVSNGVDTDFFSYDDAARQRFRNRYSLKNDEKVVISVGHLIKRKGILDFIQMAERMPDIKFMWFGYTDRRLLPENIKSAIDNAPGNISFPGYINQNELRDAYCGCDIFAFASFEETEGIVVLEALSCKTQTIVRDIPVYAGWLENRKNIYKACDKDEFCRLIRGICDGSLPNLSSEERATAESRSIESMGKKLQGIYELCFSKHCKEKEDIYESEDKRVESGG